MTRELAPYLNFDGNAREVMEFYHSIFGGKLTIQKVGEGMPSGKPEIDERTMHADLQSDAIHIMASDGEIERPVKFGDSVSLSLMGNDSEALKTFFTKLSDGGKVDQPLMAAPWGDEFGMLTDKFGIHWMFNISK